MDVRGYPTGPIDAKGAFTSEIDLPPIIKPGPLNTVAEADRPQLIDQPGMRHKYLPLRHDPATGAISSGGRYLFRGYEDATKYRDFLEEPRLPELFPAFLEAARRLDLAHVSLMFQPEHNLVGVLTAAARERRQAPSFETLRFSADALALRGSVSEARLIELGARKVFDRTSLNLAVWLPLSEQAGGAPAIWPNSPPIPVPGVEHLGGAQPKAA